jgi:hypothetical protein
MQRIELMAKNYRGSNPLLQYACCLLTIRIAVVDDNVNVRLLGAISYHSIRHGGIAAVDRGGVGGIGIRTILGRYWPRAGSSSGGRLCTGQYHDSSDEPLNTKGLSDDAKPAEGERDDADSGIGKRDIGGPLPIVDAVNQIGLAPQQHARLGKTEEHEHPGHPQGRSKVSRQQPQAQS